MTDSACSSDGRTFAGTTDDPRERELAAARLVLVLVEQQIEALHEKLARLKERVRVLEEQHRKIIPLKEE